MGNVAFLGIAYIGQQRAAGPDGGGRFPQPEGVRILHVEALADPGRPRHEVKPVLRRLAEAGKPFFQKSHDRFVFRRPLGQHGLPGHKAAHLVEDMVHRVGFEERGAKLACGHVAEGRGPRVHLQADGADVV